MKIKKPFSTLISIAVIFAVFSIFVIDEFANAQKICRWEQLKVVRILGSSEKGDDLKVDPAEINIPTGSCIVWVNWSKGPEVQVVFEEGKICYDVTRQGGGFKLDEKNCFVTNFIPYGGTSSLTFKEKGLYEYIVLTKGGHPVHCKLNVIDLEQQ